MIPFEIKPCQTNVGLDAIPTRETELSLEIVEANFGSLGTTSRVMVTEIEGVQILVHRYGKITFKACKDETFVSRVAQSIYEVAIES